jgi:hypothetical protein
LAARHLRTRVVSGFQSKCRAGDARSTLLISLITGTAAETGAREPADTAIDLSYRRQRLDRYRESRPCGAILRFGVRTASWPRVDYRSNSSGSLQPGIVEVRSPLPSLVVCRTVSPSLLDEHGDFAYLGVEMASDAGTARGKYAKACCVATFHTTSWHVGIRRRQA